MSRLPIAMSGLLVLALVFESCRSAEGWREQADHDVYDLVLGRRNKLGIGDGSFTIEPPKDSLRERLLRGEDRPPAPLTLVQCLEIAAENSRTYRTQEESLYLSALDLTLERWQFQVHENGVLGAAVQGTGDTAETATGNADFALSKVLGTGALVVGNIGLDLSRSLTTGDSWNPIGTIGLAITQPLLRGAGAKITLEPLTQSQRNLVYAVRAFERFRRTFAFDVATRYYALLEQQDSISNQQKNYENLQKLSERNAALSEAGRLDDVQAGQARQNELRSGDTLLQARARLELDKDAFKLFLGLPPEIDLEFDAGELERLADQDLSPLELDEGQAVALALATRLDHQNAVDQGDDSIRHIAVAEDALRAGLSLAAGWSNSTEAGKPATFNFQHSTWSVGAVLDLPLDRLQERNTYREAVIAGEVSRRAIDLSIDSIHAALRQELRETKSKLESWRIQLNAVDLAARQTQSTDLKLQAGRALTRDLLDAQEALLEARNAASAALIDYTLSRLALFRDLELLRVDAAGIHVDSSALPVSDGAKGETPEAAQPPAAEPKP